MPFFSLHLGAEAQGWDVFLTLPLLLHELKNFFAGSLCFLSVGNLLSDDYVPSVSVLSTTGSLSISASVSLFSLFISTEEVSFS